MEGRALTNLLLAIIAGVLLFGKDAMVNGIQGGAILLVVVVGAFLIFWMISSFVASLIHDYRDAKSPLQRLFILFIGPFISVFCLLWAYAGLLWLGGASRPLDAAIDSGLGLAFLAMLILAALVAAMIGTTRVTRRLWANRRDWPFYWRLWLRYIATWAAAPILFPIRGWKMSRAQGAGVISSAVSTVVAGIFGLIVFLGFVSVLFAATMFALLQLGLIR